MSVVCVGCGRKLKNALVAFSDAEWQKINGKPICRNCCSAIAHMVVDEYD